MVDGGNEERPAECSRSAAEGGEPARDEPADDPSVPDQHLRAALEFVVSLAAVATRHRPPLPVPAGLRRYTRMRELPEPALGAVRAIVDADHDFRRRMAMAAEATPELVDDVGRAWLSRSAGWRDEVRRSLADGTGPSAGDHEDEPDGPASLRREQRRRLAAEEGATRARLELAAAHAVAHDAQRRFVERERELRAELAAARRELEESRAAARRVERAARSRATDTGSAADASEVVSLRRALAEATAARDAAVAARDAALADRVAEWDTAPSGAGLDLERLRTTLREALAAVGEVTRAERRRPLAIPGALAGDSAAEAAHLLRRPGVRVIVDGYNVAKTGWPERDLAGQRTACVATAEEVATRWGTAVTVVFDGAEVPGAHAGGRRLVKVSWSVPGETADDVVRRIVRSLPPSTAVVVVTNDRAVVDDVRAMGANVLRSEQFLAAARR